MTLIRLATAKCTRTATRTAGACKVPEQHTADPAVHRFHSHPPNARTFSASSLAYRSVAKKSSTSGSVL